MRGSRARRSLIVGGLGALCWAASAAWLSYRAGADRPKAYEKQVRRIEAARRDSDRGAVVLTGSSFIERWMSSARDLALLRTVNIGIGGTKIGDHLAYLARMVVPFAPRVLVVYAGSNDINGIPFLSKSAPQVADRVCEYMRLVHGRLPDVRVFYIAITETPSRRRVRTEIQYANRLLAEMAEAEDFTFIDTAPALLTPEGEIDRALFGRDRLHFNERGYERFASVVRAAVSPAKEGTTLPGDA